MQKLTFNFILASFLAVTSLGSILHFFETPFFLEMGDCTIPYTAGYITGHLLGKIFTLAIGLFLLTKTSHRFWLMKVRPF